MMSGDIILIEWNRLIALFVRQSRCKWICLYVDVFSIFICIHVYIYVYLYIYTYIYIYICVWTHAFICIF
jgi:hypothetical protein